ncbi:MAG: hypothetical protein WCS72_18345 [Deltaproteobacteria bacterium]
MTPAEMLGPAMVEAIRAIVREEQGRAGQVEAAPELLTPPQASEALGGRPSADTIAAWVRSGRLPRRVNNVGANPRRPNYLVDLDEVRAALKAPAGEAESPPSLEEARARARAKIASRGGRT